MKTLMLALVLVSQVAFAAIGKIVTLEGKATRTPQGGAAVELKVGSEVELKDTLKVSGGNLKLELNDGSQIALSDKGELFIDDAQFEGQECKGFMGTLKSGSLWTKVKKLLGGSKYDIISLGADGVEGGENDDKDIHSAEDQMPGG